MSKVDFSDPLFFLNVIGMHPFKNDRVSKLRRAFSLTVYAITIFSGVMELGFNSEGLETYARASESMVPQTQLVVKMVVLIVHRRQIGQLLKDSGRFWALDVFGSQYKDSFSRVHHFLKRFFLLYKTMIIFTCLQFLAVKIVFKIKKPVCISYGESEGLEAPYEQMYLILHISITLVSINVINGFDGLFFYFIGHILSELQMVKVAFGNYNIGTPWNERTRFRMTAKHHSRVLEFVQHFNSVFSVVLLVQHMSCLFGICFGLFLMSKDGLPPDVDRASKYIPYIVSFILQTFTFCFGGHILTDWSLEIPQEIFYNDWAKDYDYENRLGRVISIKRGQKAAKLTLGDFGALDLESFKLVKTTNPVVVKANLLFVF
ncbi:hypothetical protein Zmor_023119 [Zophobas morio]|uniref:Odorant receptor n=1 Tax=Zophobas morio TaxID=2755281 RepID=A0AA38HXT6_9CUCU|nr:hypothetical protein Zmor_023119 [Zophobas morio]